MTLRKFKDFSSKNKELVFDIDSSDKGYIFQAWLFIYSLSIAVKLYTYVDEYYVIECINCVFAFITIMYGIVLIKSERKARKEIMYKLKIFEDNIILHIKESDDHIDEIGTFVHESFKRKSAKKKTLFY